MEDRIRFESKPTKTGNIIRVAIAATFIAASISFMFFDNTTGMGFFMLACSELVLLGRLIKDKKPIKLNDTSGILNANRRTSKEKLEKLRQ